VTATGDVTVKSKVNGTAELLVTLKLLVTNGSLSQVAVQLFTV